MQTTLVYPPNYAFLNRPRIFWNDAHYAELAQAEKIADLLSLAFKVLHSIPGKVGQVCGPISTGGRGSVEANLRVFDSAILKLTDNDRYIFDQMPFEPKLSELMENAKQKGEKLNILSEFYFPIFRSGKIKEFYFIYDWQSSEGAKWEREQGGHFSIKMIDLPEDFV